MAYQDVELEQQLRDAGNQLVQQSLPVDELLNLLDQAESYLSRVEQSPPRSMLDALSPLMTALVEDGLLRHSDVDVKVAVASCISEITRITAPDAPYDDDKMKDVFQLIVSSFEHLPDQSSRSYSKRASILETVAKVRSCVVMLDLECDGLIVEMFHHFLKAIRDYHSENIFSSMETIMTLVLEESEDISLEMLTSILTTVKKDNEEVLPVARKLGEQVLEKCADKLKPCLMQAVNSLGASLDDYSQVVTSICKGTAGAVEHNDENASGVQLAEDSKLAKATSDEAAKASSNEAAKASSDEAAKVEESKLTTASSEAAAHVAKEGVAEGPCPEEVDPAVDRSPKSVMSNGIMETGNVGAAVDQESSKKLEHDQPPIQLNINLTSKVETDDSDAGKLAKTESKPEQSAKRRGKKSNTIINPIEPSDSSRVDDEKEPAKLSDRRQSRSKDVPSSPVKDPSTEAALPSENEKDTDIPVSSPKAIANAASSSPSQSPPDESLLKKAGRSKKKQSLIQEDVPSVENVSTRAPEGRSDSELKPQRRAGKKAPAGSKKEDKISAAVGTSKKGGTTSDSEAKLPKQSGKKVDACDSDSAPSRLSVKKGDASDSDSKPAQTGKKGDSKGVETKTLKQTDKKADASDSEAKPLKQSGKRGNSSNILEDKSSLKKKEDGKKLGREKNAAEKDLTKSSAEDDEMISPPKSTTKSAKDESNLEEAPTTSSKRKRTTGKEEASQTIEHGENLVGSRVKVWWPKDKSFYEGVIESYDPVKMKHKVSYVDGDEEVLNLKKELWEIVKDNSVNDGEQGTEDQIPDDSSETHKKKKAKTDSSKSKGTGSKSRRKSKDEEKVDNKSKHDIASKSSGKSEDGAGGKSKDKLQKGRRKRVDDVSSKQAGESKDDDAATPKATTKSKQETPKTVNKWKGKTPQSGNKANANGSGKVKASSSEAKESEDKKGKSDTGKTPESVKGKSPDITKAQSGVKNGKKRKKRT